MEVKMVLRGVVKKFPDTDLPISNAVGEVAEIELTAKEISEQILHEIKVMESHELWNLLVEKGMIAKNLGVDDFSKRLQRQDSLEDQLRDVLAKSNEMGCYDATDFIQSLIKNNKVV